MDTSIVPVTEPGPFHAVSKRCLDVFVVVACLLLLVPLMVPIAIAIKFDSRGPVLYRARRLGRHGCPFTVLKFRTMFDGADRNLDTVRALSITNGPSFKAPRDPRMTRVGRLLRKSSLDELPQLVCVLRGQMSIVGPRPVSEIDFRGYEWALQKRNQVKPGLTGLWQVSGRSNLPFEDMMRLDLQYVDERSLLLDLAVILRTVPAVLSGRGAM